VKGITSGPANGLAAMAAAMICWAASPPAAAAEAGDNVVQVGWLHLMPMSDSTPLHTNLKPSLIGSLAGVQSSFDSPGTSATVESADTAALITTHFFTEHLAGQLVSGVPAQVSIDGKGKVAPTGLLGNFINVDLGASNNNPLVTVREWTPVVLLQYYFGQAHAKLHPYVGVGFSYAWFSDFDVNGNFKSQLESSFGKVLGLATGHTGPTKVSASASRSWNGAFNAGMAYDLSPHWSVAGSITYAPLSSTAHIDISAADGTLLSSSNTRLSQDALVTALLVNYRFKLKL
jgi:outer membrane protein